MHVSQALDAFPSHPNRSAVLGLYRRFVDAMLAVQDTQTGRWHQVVNETSTFLETSSTAMMVTSLATGITRGW